MTGTMRTCEHCESLWRRIPSNGTRLCPSCEVTHHWCSACSSARPHDFFSRNRSKRTGFDSRCKTCDVAHKLKNRYGIDPVEYLRLHTLQSGLCAICKLPPAEGQPLVVDHCHVGLQVRGLLCAPCNSAIGLLRDNPDVIRSAAAYVETHQAS